MRHAPLLALIAVLAAAAPAPAATHGDVVSVKKTKPVATLKGAAKDLTVTYLTKGVGGKLVPVTGTVAFPKGAAPKGGWPVLNWAHGSTGIADTCAPSIRGKRELVHPMLLQLLKAGFVVVRTDYEGLGTPGVHPFFIGTSEGRSVLDIARAARKLDANVGHCAEQGRPLPGRSCRAVGSVARSEVDAGAEGRGNGGVRARLPHR